MKTVLIHEVREYCNRLINESRCKKMPFHNWRHTLDVVKVVNCIGVNENVSEQNIETLICAAYFHDTGYIKPILL